MSNKYSPLVLSEAERLQLAHIAKRGDNWRARKCSRTLLTRHSGTSINAVAAEQGLDRDTFMAKGVDALVNATRSGTPRKLHPDVVQATERFPLAGEATRRVQRRVAALGWHRNH